MAYLKQHEKDKRGIIGKVFADLKMSRYMIGMDYDEFLELQYYCLPFLLHGFSKTPISED
eukprot:Pgem_evm1s6357